MKNKIMILLLFLLCINVAYALEKEKIYQITLKYDKEIITKEDLIVTMGFPEHRKIHLADDYKLELISFDNKVLYSTYFNFPLEIFAEPPKEWFDEKGNQIYFPTAKEAGHIILDEATQLIVIPYFKDGKQINIYDKDNNLVLEIDISYFAECRIKGYDCIKTKFPYWIFILLLIIIFIFYYEYKREN